MPPMFVTGPQEMLDAADTEDMTGNTNIVASGVETLADIKATAGL